MMFRSLYARLMVVFTVVLFAALAMLSAFFYGFVRNDTIESRLKVLTSQAYDVAYLASMKVKYGSLSLLDDYLVWKAYMIGHDYGGEVRIFKGNRELLSIGNGTVEMISQISPDTILSMLTVVLSGEPFEGKVELEVDNFFFAVGVPYYVDGRVAGGVFILASERNITEGFEKIQKNMALVVGIELSMMALLILLISQHISRPLRQMARAADRYACGDFQQRIPVESVDEVGRLAVAMNSMAVSLDQLEQTRRGFVANVSHELRSPLTSMQGFISGILDGTIDESEREHYLGIVLDETRRLNKLITTLLDLSQLEGGQSEVSFERFDINEMIFRVLARQEGRIEARRMDVEIEFADESCFVLADADRIEQVVINLTDNAIKYGKENGRLRIVTERTGGVVKVTIADDGQGISEAELPFIFDRFYTVDKAHTKGLGTGLGLAIVKSIMDQHGQTIRAESTVGMGTRFIFTLKAG